LQNQGNSENLKKILPKYLKNWSRYFNLVLQQESPIRGEELFNVCQDWIKDGRPTATFIQNLF